MSGEAAKISGTRYLKHFESIISYFWMEVTHLRVSVFQQPRQFIQNSIDFLLMMVAGYWMLADERHP